MLARIAKCVWNFSFWAYMVYADFSVNFARYAIANVQYVQRAAFVRGAPAFIISLKKLCARRLQELVERFGKELNVIKLAHFNNYNQIEQLLARLDLIITDGFLIDNLQKKMYNTWSKKFLLLSVFAFNERWLFEKLSRSVLDQILWPAKAILYTDGFGVFSAIYPIVYAFFGIFVVANICLVISITNPFLIDAITLVA